MFLLYRDPDGRRHMFALPSALSRATIGRRQSCDVALPWDDQVSRLHAELLRMGDDWVICDDGLSHNGTFVNGERVRSRRRLVAGDDLQVGACTLAVGEPERAATTAADPARGRRARGPPRHARPAPAARGPLPGPVPPSNREIADELGISVDTVKATLTVLFERFELEALPQNAKRAALARALQR